MTTSTTSDDSCLILKTVVRRNASNLFVRLAPVTARRLRSLALEREKARDNSDRKEEWTVVSSSSETSTAARCASGVEFLPLALTSFGDDSKTVYASYNGGDCQEGAAADCVEVPEGLFSWLQTNDTVTVRALSTVRNAARVFVEPCSLKDWDLLQTHAAALEGGLLLRQVSVVFEEQVVPVRTGNEDVARIRILSRTFSENSKKSVWPDDDDEEEESSGDDEPCLRLVADTEVIVSPIEREQKQLDTKLRIHWTRNDFEGNEVMLELAEKLDVALVYVDQGAAVVHPDTLRRIVPSIRSEEARAVTLAMIQTVERNSWRNFSSNTESRSASVVRITASTDVPRDHIAMHPLVRKRTRVGQSVTLRVMSPVEVAERSRPVYQLVRRNRARLVLVPVELFHEEVASPWRRPDAAAPNVAMNAGKEPQPLSLGHMADCPVEIGGVLSLAWNGNERTLPYRLALEGVPKGVDLPDLGGGVFIFARDVVEFVQTDPWDSSAQTAEAEVVPAPLGPSISIPSSSLLTPSLLGVAQGSLDNTCTLIFGDRGSGKTQTALTVASCALLEKGCSTVYLDCRKLKASGGLRMNTILAELQAAFDEAVSSSSSVLILDDLDELAPNLSKSDLMDDSAQVQQVNPATVDQAKLICDVVRQFLRRREELGRDGLHIVVTCRDAESLPSSLISDGSFGTPIPSPTYNASEREAIFLKMVQRFCTSLDSPVSESTATLDIGGKTRSFMPRDFERLAIRLTRHLSVRDSRGDFKTLLNEEFENFVPLSRLGAAEEAVGGSLSWSDIGGLFDAKSDLTSTILHPSLYRRIYERSRIRLPRGILLFGPPGNGKSVLVPALAQECGYPLIMCRGPELLDKYIGASEAKVRDLFSRAASAAPSILFLDELDALAPRRGSDHTGVTDRVVNQLLTFLDGVEDGSKGGSVYVIAATSRPDKVDPALLRPGRLEKHVYVGYPEQPDELTDLLSKLALKSSVEAETMDLITSGQFIQNAQKDSGLPTGLSAADYQSLFRIAHLSAVHEALAAGRTNEKVMIRYDHLKDAFRSARPSLSSSDYSRLQAVYLPFRNMKDVATHRGADAASGSSTVYRERMLRTALR